MTYKSLKEPRAHATKEEKKTFANKTTRLSRVAFKKKRGFFIKQFQVKTDGKKGVASWNLIQKIQDKKYHASLPIVLSENSSENNKTIK